MSVYQALNDAGAFWYFKNTPKTSNWVLKFEATLGGSPDVPNPPCSMWIQGSSFPVRCLEICVLSSVLLQALWCVCAPVCVCVRLCVCVRGKRPNAQSQLRSTPPGHYRRRAWEGKLGNRHAQMHVERPRGLGTGATSKPALCLFHQLGMNSEREKRWNRQGERKEWYDSKEERGETRWHLVMEMEQKRRGGTWVKRGDAGTPEEER